MDTSSAETERRILQGLETCCLPLSLDTSSTETKRQNFEGGETCAIFPYLRIAPQQKLRQILQRVETALQGLSHNLETVCSKLSIVKIFGHPTFQGSQRFQSTSLEIFSKVC